MAKRTKVNLDDPGIKELTEKIAGLLGETDERAVFGIKAIVAINGDTFALQRLIEAAKMKRNGITLKTDDGLRYRTLGGVFFKLCKEKMSGANRFHFMSLTSPKKQDRKEQRNGRR